MKCSSKLPQNCTEDQYLNCVGGEVFVKNKQSKNENLKYVDTIAWIYQPVLAYNRCVISLCRFTISVQ